MSKYSHYSKLSDYICTMNKRVTNAVSIEYEAVFESLLGITVSFTRPSLFSVFNASEFTECVFAVLVEISKPALNVWSFSE